MKAILLALVTSICASLRGRVALQLESLALRHQLGVYHRRHPRARTQLVDRLLWAWLSRAWGGWRGALVFIQPSTVAAWQRRRLRDHSARLSGRPWPDALEAIAGEGRMDGSALLEYFARSGNESRSRTGARPAAGEVTGREGAGVPRCDAHHLPSVSLYVSIELPVLRGHTGQNSSKNGSRMAPGCGARPERTLLREVFVSGKRASALSLENEENPGKFNTCRGQMEREKGFEPFHPLNPNHATTRCFPNVGRVFGDFEFPSASVPFRLVPSLSIQEMAGRWQRQIHRQFST